MGIILQAITDYEKDKTSGVGYFRGNIETLSSASKKLKVRLLLRVAYEIKTKVSWNLWFVSSNWLRFKTSTII